LILDCRQIFAGFYDDNYDGNDDSGGIAEMLLFRLRRQTHLFLCPDCAREERRLKIASRLMENDFFPSAPDLSDSIMALVRNEEIPLLSAERHTVPLRGWVIAGFFLLLSLISAYFSGNILNIDTLKSSSYMLPAGIVVGMIVITYGSIFIGTHLDELRKKFGVGDEN
jgi:hypothetical protein